MKRKIKIYITDIPPLIEHSIRKLIADSDFDCEIISPDSDTEQRSSADFHIISAMEFFRDLSFYLPRKQQCAVFIGESVRNLAVPENDIFTFGVYDSAASVRIQLENAFQNCAGDETVSAELSAREKEVLTLLASGKTIKEIAHELNISVNTTLTHRKNISTKLGIRSVSGLSVYAMMNGLL